MNMPTTRTLSRLLPALVLLAVVAVGTMGAGAVSPDTVAQTESASTADASSPNAYDYVNKTTGVVTIDGLLDAIDDFRADNISRETLLDIIESFRSNTPLAGFEFTDQSVAQTNGAITVTNLEARGGEGLTTDHLVVFSGATVDADAIVGSVQLESLDGVTPNQSVITRDRVDIPIDKRSVGEGGKYTVALHANMDGSPNPDPDAVRPWTVQTASVTVAVDGTVLEFREVDGEVTDDPVTEGEELTAYAAIENVGTDNKTKTATFRVNGEPIDTTRQTITPGEREKLLFIYQTAAGDSPSVNISLALEETETATTTAEVRRSSEFVVNLADVTDPAPVTGGETGNVTAEVRVENVGGGTETLSRNITLSIGGTATDTQNVTLQNGETTRIELDGSGAPVSGSNTTVEAAVNGSGDSSERVVTLAGSVTFNDQVLGTNANGSDAVLVEDVSTSDDAAVVVTYENNAGDLIIAGLTEIQSNSLGSEDVTVVIEDTGGFPGEHVAHLIPTSDLSTNYSAGDTVSSTTASAVVDNEAATVFDGSVNIADQQFEDNTSDITIDTSDLQPAAVSDYVIVVHNQTGVPAGGVGPPIGFSDNLTGAKSNVPVSLTEEINQTTPLLAMIHFPGDPAGTPIPTLNDTAFGISGGQAGTVTDTATIEIQQAGNFTVSNLSPQSATVNESETFDVSATVENTGDAQGTQPVELRLEPDGNPVASQSVQLAVGNSTTVTFENVSVDTPGVYNHTVASSDDRATGDLTVQSLANFTVTIDDTPNSVTAGDDIQVNYTVENVGDQQGTQDIDFSVNGTNEGTEPAVTLNRGETFSDSFIYTTVGSDVPEATVAVSSANDTASETVPVDELAPANFGVSNLSAPAEAAENESITVNATVTNTGDQQGTQDVLFQLDGDGNFDNPAVSVVAEENLTLAGGASQEVQLTVNAPDAVGVFEHGLFTADDNQTRTLTVGNPQVVASLSDESGAVGENVTVEFNISSFDNTQREVGSYDLNMTFDPSVVEFIGASNNLDGLLTVVDEDADQGQVKLSYADTGSTSTPLTAATITFNVTADAESNVAIVEADSEVNDENANTLNTIFDGGSVSSSTASTVARTVLAPPVA
jgi:hypothetical protein